MHGSELASAITDPSVPWSFPHLHNKCSFSNGPTTGVLLPRATDTTKSGRKFIEGVHSASLDVETKDRVGRDRATGTNCVASESVGGAHVTNLQQSAAEVNPAWGNT